MFLDEVELVSGGEVQITYRYRVEEWRNVPVSGGRVRTTYRFSGGDNQRTPVGQRGAYNVLVFEWRQRTSDEWTGTDIVLVTSGQVQTSY